MDNAILVVDDEAGIRQSLKGILEDEGFEVETVASGEECVKLVSSRCYGCVLLDVWLPGMDGIEVLERIKEVCPETSVVMISGHATIETAVKATKMGALDFIEKPLQLEKTVQTVKLALTQHGLAVENRKSLLEIIGESAPMRALRQQIAIAAPTQGRVLIYGESGTGKELVANALHRQSQRAKNNFVAMNCSAVPEDLIESELFGHVKGAFTGASSPKQGKFELAHQGTLFLDEVGDMSPKMQAKVLRVLEEQKFEPVGSSTAISVDVRIISATNKRLAEEMERGNFRADLFYRLNVIPFQIPPLREHLEDVPLLVEHFNRVFAARNNKPVKEFTVDAIELMQNYDWPGNVRELRNLVERIVIMVPKVKITANDLPIRRSEKPASSYDFSSYKEASEAYEREFLCRKLAEWQWNISRTAEAIGIDRSHLYRRMKALGIPRNGQP
ncbi:MAG: sigma-54 dependent transcriptional regulator [Acidobacteriota bacterium]|nr:sigma-54 dependent transcriptional regulator [Blastocatellia bacterium]MDW8411672.1 sigma-54 dependent transcriptional regulator [Acidobacteriota bacterium]